MLKTFGVGVIIPSIISEVIGSIGIIAFVKRQNLRIGPLKIFETLIHIYEGGRH